MVVAREVLLISQGVILDHFGKLFFSKDEGGPEAFGDFFNRYLSEVELFNWVREQTGWMPALFSMYAHTTKELGRDDATISDKGVIVSDQDKSCKWPDCEAEGVDKDHILPKSGLRGGVETSHFVKHFKTKRGEGWNGQYLCAYHNRIVKSNSVGIGLACLMLRFEE